MTKNLVLQVESYNLVILVLGAGFFSRVIAAIGLPSVVNFLHFAFILIALSLILSKIYNRVSAELLVGTLVLLGVIAFSATLNSAGAINVVLDFLLLVEPFLLLLIMVSTRWSSVNTKRFRLWLFIFSLLHVIFAWLQRLALGLSGDDVKGVMLNQGNGHHVGGAVALSAAVYFFTDFPTRSNWQRIAFAVAATAAVIFADAKQVILVFLLSLLIMSLFKLKNIKKAFLYVAIIVAAVGFLFLAADTVFPALKSWTNLDQNREGLELKFSVFQILSAHYSSPLNWLLGLGPGHTIGRLGWLLPEYSEYLQPLGATTSPVTQLILDISQKPGSITNASTGSSIWSLLFSWAGVWGDLGFLGLGAYLYLWFVTWRRICLDDLSKFLLLNPIIFGCIFAWLEEPGYMLFVAALIGLRWHEYQSKAKNNSLEVSRKIQQFEAI